MNKTIIGMILASLMLVGMAMAVTVTMDPASGPGTAYDNQYIYNYDYNSAHVTVTFNSIDTNFKAHISATGLKPGFTYQLKFEGKGSLASTAQERATNELIGLNGRWWYNGNQDDTYYNANKNSVNIVGYMVFDWLTADSNGNIDADVAVIGSYHVLFCGTPSSNTDLYFVNKTVPPFSTNTLKCTDPMLCPSAEVMPQVERAITKLPQGNYSNVILTLNEESFHQVCGTWTTAMTKNISFDVDYLTNSLVNPSTGNVIGAVTVSPQCGADFGASLSASGLAANGLYQIKLEGKPTCVYGADGNDVANENIGMQGRFWCTNNCPCAIDPNWGGCNIDDKTVYQAHKNDSGFCAKGYLLYKCLNADASGNINQDISGITTSYEYCPVVMGSATLPNGTYNVKLLLGENFGNWNTIGTQFLSFKIGNCSDDGGAQVPEFGLIAGAIALVGLIVGVTILRKKQ
jgi:hypothetical protein